ncbi:MAG TPA: aldo/keto reductase [Methanomassiliicoccales archaeon]|jgi:aryl-alcohol dehydrogenase-like predicted oxidoreductase
MRYKLFGKGGLKVSELCLGTMTFGEDWGWGASKEESKRIFDAYVNAGGTFVDTANGYTNGTSEKYVGEFIAQDRERFVLATKFTFGGKPDNPNGGGNHRKSMFQALNASLKRLNTDYVDIYWVHAWDQITPLEELMRGLDDMVRAGKVLYVGFSDAPAWVVARANAMAEERGWTIFTGLQIPYSLVERTPERELLPMAKHLDLTVMAWSPLGGGILSGKYNTGNAEKDARMKQNYARNPFALSERNLKVAEQVVEIAKEMNRTPSQIALNWLKQKRNALIVPILGTRRLAQMEDNLACLDFSLNEATMKRLDEVSDVDLGFPNSFLGREINKKMILGDYWDSLDNHRA